MVLTQMHLELLLPLQVSLGMRRQRQQQLLWTGVQLSKGSLQVAGQEVGEGGQRAGGALPVVAQLEQVGEGAELLPEQQQAQAQPRRVLMMSQPPSARAPW